MDCQRFSIPQGLSFAFPVLRKLFNCSSKGPVLSLDKDQSVSYLLSPLKELIYGTSQML